MKKSKVKKVAHKIITEYFNSRIGDELSEKSNEITYELMYSDSNDDVKNKTRELIYRILEYRDKLNFSTDSYHINFNTNVRTLKKSNRNQLSMEEDPYLDISIVKDMGFMITYNDSKKIAFLDPDLYKDVLEKSKEIFNNINHSNFNDLFSNVMKDSGLSREFNLDVLLKN